MEAGDDAEEEVVEDVEWETVLGRGLLTTETLAPAARCPAAIEPLPFEPATLFDPPAATAFGTVAVAGLAAPLVRGLASTFVPGCDAPFAVLAAGTTGFG